MNTTDLDELLNQHFAGRVVRKDLTKLVKEGANVPVYVLEYLLGNYCASSDPEIIEDGLNTVKNVLAENYVRPDEAEKVKSTIRERGSLKIIDKVTVTLNEKRDVYEALLSNLGTKGVEIPTGTVKKYEKLLAGGIWSIITMQYFFEEGQKGSPFIIEELKPIQMPNMDMMSCSKDEITLPKNNGSTYCCDPAVTSRPTLSHESKCTCSAGWCRWSRTTLTSANLVHEEQARATSTKRSVPTASWSLVGRRPLPTCSTT